MITLYHVRNAFVAFGVICAIGFMGLVFGVKLVPQWQREKETAFLSREPVQAAQEDYAQGNLRFVRIFEWFYIDEKWSGSWVVAAHPSIDPKLLEAHPKYRDLKRTAVVGLTLESDELDRQARVFARRYNLAAALLFLEEEEEQEE